MEINDLVELKDLPTMITAKDEAPTNNQRAILSWILEQNWTADREAEATGIVQRLQARAEAEKEHARHMQRQAPKPPKKPKKPEDIGRKQKNAARKPPPVQPRVDNNNRTRRNRRNRQRKQAAIRNKMRNKRERMNQQNRRYIGACQVDATSLEFARPRAYQTANHNDNGYYHSPRHTQDRFSELRQKPKKFQRFARVDLPEDCTITDIRSGWETKTDGSRVWKYTLEATPLKELIHKEGNHHVATCSIGAGEQPIRDNYIRHANLHATPEDFSPTNGNSEDGFPHKELPIFARNEKIRQDLNDRERKRNKEKERDGRTWSQWDQHHAGLVQRYDAATQRSVARGTQRFTNAAAKQHETSFISRRVSLYRHRTTVL